MDKASLVKLHDLSERLEYFLAVLYGMGLRIKALEDSLRTLEGSLNGDGK